jgi:alkanesulfonate monooxygenase SsuD/methylene tetrahydromethanopterin reductase-like flavin-dependent oxidoreductase (luciferase family)
VPIDRRFDRFEDGLRFITSMLRDGRATHDGRVLSARSAVLSPRGPRATGLPVMVGANGPRMLRLTAELADHWNGGMRSIDEVPALLAALDAACAAVGRDPATVTRSVEVLVRPRDADADREEREIRGTPDAIATALRRFGALGIHELQVQLRPNSVAGVEAFAPVIDAIRRG